MYGQAPEIELDPEYVEVYAEAPIDYLPYLFGAVAALILYMIWD